MIVLELVELFFFDIGVVFFIGLYVEGLFVQCVIVVQDWIIFDYLLCGCVVMWIVLVFVFGIYIIGDMFDIVVLFQYQNFQVVFCQFFGGLVVVDV